jgi:hypothetical protein
MLLPLLLSQRRLLVLMYIITLLLLLLVPLPLLLLVRRYRFCNVLEIVTQLQKQADRQILRKGGKHANMAWISRQQYPQQTGMQAADLVILGAVMRT